MSAYSIRSNEIMNITSSCHWSSCSSGISVTVTVAKHRILQISVTSSAHSSRLSPWQFTKERLSKCASTSGAPLLNFFRYPSLSDRCQIPFSTRHQRLPNQFVTMNHFVRATGVHVVEIFSNYSTSFFQALWNVVMSLFPLKDGRPQNR